MRLTKLIAICSALLVNTQLLANDMLNESSLRQCISYNDTMDQQQAIVQSVDEQIDQALAYINNSETELHLIKAQLDELVGAEKNELVATYNNLNDERNKAIQRYNEAHKTRQISVSIFNQITEQYNQQCVNVRVSKGIYENACSDKSNQGYCNTFEFN